MKMDIPIYGKNILLLQGPVGPFFKHLRSYFLAAPSVRRVIKVNFNLGDDLYFNKGYIERFKSKPLFLKDFYHKIMTKHDIDCVYLFGDCRLVHKIAIAFFKEHHIPVYVFEEGYIRPSYITLEQGGVNGFSGLLQNLEEIKKTPYDIKCDMTKHHGYSSFWKMMRYALFYFIMVYVSKWHYPYYKHHKKTGIKELCYWGLSYLRKPIYYLYDRAWYKKTFIDIKENYFFIPLQTHNDAQLNHHSHYHDMYEFLKEVIFSFTQHAPKDTHLVIKHHPFDRGHRHYKAYMTSLIEQYDLKGRVHYVHEIRLPKLLRHAKVTIVVNSTVGLSSLFHGTPVKVMGRAFYDIANITIQDPLNDIWTKEYKVPEDFNIYRTYIIHHSQISGSFYQ